jgi:hypothetical protein
VFNLVTGCVSPQYHCKFDDFFETTHYSGPDVSGTICWQQLAGLMGSTQILSDIARSVGRTAMSNKMISDPPLETHVPSEEFPDTEIDYNHTHDDVSGSGDSQASRTPHQSNASNQAEGVTPSESRLSAGTSWSGRVRTMLRRMADSKSQHNFYGTSGMHYMADMSKAYLNETPEDLFHDQHLNLQARMRNPIAFQAEMMGDIMYYHQALQQPDAQ